MVQLVLQPRQKGEALQMLVAGISIICSSSNYRWHVACFLKKQSESIDRFLVSNPQFSLVTTTRQLAGFDLLNEQVPCCARSIVDKEKAKESIINQLPARKRGISRESISKLSILQHHSTAVSSF